MVRKRITRRIDEIPETRSAKRKKVEDLRDSSTKPGSSQSKHITSPKVTTPARKRKPKLEHKSEENEYKCESEDSSAEVGVKKKQRTSIRGNQKNARQNNEEKPDKVEKMKGRKKTTKISGKKEIQKRNEKSCSQKVDHTSFADADNVPAIDIGTSLPIVKLENLGGNAMPANKNTKRKRAKNPKITKNSSNESTEDKKSKLDDQYDGISRVNEWVKTEGAADADSSGGESEEDIDWEDVQEAEGHHGVDLCDNSSISSSTAYSFATTKTENKSVEISIQIPGMKGKRKKKTEDDLLTKIQKAMARFKRQIQLDMHKVHLIALVAWGFNRNAVCNQPVLQAYCLSYIPSHLVTKSVKKWQSEDLTNLITWFKEDFPSLQQLTDDLSKGDVVPVSSCPKNMAEVLVILLRSLGILTRLVSSLQPLSMKVPKDGKAAPKKLNASKTIQSSEKSNVKRTPSKAEKLSDAQPESTLGDTEVIDSKQMETTTNNENSPASSTSTSVESLSPSSSCKAKIKPPPLSSQSKVKSSVKRSNKTETPRQTKSSKVESKKKTENELNDAASGPKRKMLRKQKKVNYADDAASGSGDEDQESSYSEEKSNSESDEEFEKETKYKATVKKPPPSKAKKHKTTPTSKSKKSPSVVELIDDDDEFEVSSKPRIFRRHSSQSSKEGKSPVQMISDDSDEGVTVRKNKAGTDIWVEVYLPTSKSWWCVDLVSYSINQPELCEKYASMPLSYVLSFDNENSVKVDVTERYASNWLSKTKKLRIDAEWWEDTLLPYKTRKKKMDELEDSQLLAQHQERPLPQSITEYKNHPLYVLKRHLLKFEAIYPESAATLGFIRGEAVYSRDCLHLLHTREKWMSLEGRVVKQGQEPYKIVKGRMKRNQPVVDPSTVTIDLFGRWQTEEYKPPPVKDGKVPRNEYGNVELFKPSMLPPGSKHIKIPGIQKIAKKLGIDGAPAVVGFDFHCGFCHPVIDGLVVAKESVPALMDAWRQEQEEAQRRKEEKREKRVLGYWKQMVKSLLIRERLKRKYDSRESRISSEQNGEQLEDEKIASTAVSWPQNMKQGKTSIKDEGHCHVFPKRLHKKDKINGEWTKSCTCGFTLPLEK